MNLNLSAIKIGPFQLETLTNVRVELGDLYQKQTPLVAGRTL
jgi:hypothetical protein